jgi:hypothetical protein
MLNESQDQSQGGLNLFPFRFQINLIESQIYLGSNSKLHTRGFLRSHHDRKSIINSAIETCLANQSNEKQNPDRLIKRTIIHSLKR